MKYVFQIPGVALMLAGGLWTLQGLGLVMWPATSFMLAEPQWAVYGAITFAVGAALFWFGMRRRG